MLRNRRCRWVAEVHGSRRQRNKRQHRVLVITSGTSKELCNVECRFRDHPGRWTGCGGSREVINGAEPNEQNTQCAQGIRSCQSPGIHSRGYDLKSAKSRWDGSVVDTKWSDDGDVSRLHKRATIL